MYSPYWNFRKPLPDEHNFRFLFFRFLFGSLILFTCSVCVLVQLKDSCHVVRRVWSYIVRSVQRYRLLFISSAKIIEAARDKCVSHHHTTTISRNVTYD